MTDITPEGIWNLICVSLKQAISDQAYRDWIRPCFLAPNTGLPQIKITVPNNRFKQHWEKHYMENISTILKKHCLGSIQVEFTTTTEAYPKEETPKAETLAPMEDDLIRGMEKQIAENELLTEVELKNLISLAQAAGSQASVAMKHLSSKLSRFHYRSQRRPIDGDVYAMVRADLKTFAERNVDSQQIVSTKSLSRQEKLFDEKKKPLPGLQTENRTALAPLTIKQAKSLVFVELFRVPALLVSRRDKLRIKVKVKDRDGEATTIEVERYGRRGWSPEVAAIFEYILSKSRYGTLSQSEVSYLVNIRSGELLALLGKEGQEFDHAINFKRLIHSLTAVFRIHTFKKRGDEYFTSGVMAIRDVSRFKNGLITFEVDRVVVDSLKAFRHDEVRLIAENSLKSLARTSQLTAALTRWLCVNWHKKQYLNAPLQIAIRQLSFQLTGTELKSEVAVKKFRRRLRQSVQEINQKDLLSELGIVSPRIIALAFSPGVACFSRTAQLSAQLA
jgi:hypothetical protein